MGESPLCTLQTSCEVVKREETADSVSVQYFDRERNLRELRGSWLVGADGKRGVVRKIFLEPSAGVRQETGIFEYEGTWIAGNLKMTLPTKQSHPNFPLWELGYEPQAVYDLFWPREWHFCRPPGRAVATGRFGPHSEYLWRHELAVPEWEDSMDASELFWENLTPMITRTVTSATNELIQVTFPRDCIQVLRCRPFQFSHKVVNKWFSNRTMLIGDAAHVFPPFGGQGVACGVQDAEGLAWRLAILVKSGGSPGFQNAVLQSWAAERRSGVDKSARLTLLNGELCNNTASMKTNLLVFTVKHAHDLLTVMGIQTPHLREEARGYRDCKNGTFLTEFGGGTKLGQVYIQTRSPSSQSRKLELSDSFLGHVATIFTLLVIENSYSNDHADDDEKEDSKLINLLKESGIHPDVLSEKSIVHFDSSIPSNVKDYTSELSIASPAQSHCLIGYPSREGYDANQFMRRVGDSGAKYVIVRPDSIVYASARTLQELQNCLQLFKANLCS